MRPSLRLILTASALAIPVLAFAALSVSRPNEAAAHPLGNFTVNRYTRLELFSDVVRVKYVLDMAEIPAFQEIETIDSDGNGAPSEAESAAYLADKIPEIVDRLTLSLGGEDRRPAVLSQSVTYPEGQAGLSTVRIDLLLEVPAVVGVTTLAFNDNNYSDRVGWKEIIVAPAEGVLLSESSVSTRDVSRELTQYPGDLLSSPLDIRGAGVRFDATSGAPAPSVSSLTGAAPERAPERAGGGFASLVDTDNLTLTVILLSLLAAFGFGAVHALEPGHGKTFVAAYFVGVKGSAREAMLLGLIVAATHTIGVFAIGLLTLFGSQFILPEKLYPLLSLASGLMILLLGIRLLVMRSRGLNFLRRIGRYPFIRSTSATAQTLEHPHGHDHSHSHEPPPAGSPWKGLVALGLADGLTPSPSALIVLLAAVSLDRIGLGIMLIVAFSVGLAAVLTLVSLVLVYARRFVDACRARGHGVATHPAFAWAIGNGSSTGGLMIVLPLAGAAALTVVGLLLSLRALPGANLPLL